MLFMYALSALFWAASVANLMLRINAYFIHFDASFAKYINLWSSLPNAIILINVREAFFDTAWSSCIDVVPYSMFWLMLLWCGGRG